MPCVDRGLGLAGLKTFAWTPGGTPFLVVLMTIHEPEIVAVLEADTLGQLRTARRVRSGREASRARRAHRRSA